MTDESAVGYAVGLAKSEMSARVVVGRYADTNFGFLLLYELHFEKVLLEILVFEYLPRPISLTNTSKWGVFNLLDYKL